MNRRQCKALNFESTAKVPLQMGVQQLKKLPVFRKIIRRYVLRCERKKRQVITFVSSNFHGLRTTARNSFLPGNTTSNVGIEHIQISRWHSWAIITPFTIFKMVSWSTSAELDIADLLENTWRWKEAYRHLRCPPKVAGVVNSTYFQTLIKFDFL